jgi:hypothetical protein
LTRLVPRRQQRRDFALDFSHHLPADLAEALPKWVEELSLAIGGLGAASDPNVLYAATGEWTSGIGFPTDPVVTGVVGREFESIPTRYRRGRISSSKTSSGSKPSTPEVDIKALHAKIGELTLENDFFESALDKAGLLSARRLIDHDHDLPLTRQAAVGPTDAALCITR